MPSSGATGVAVGGHNGFSRGKTIFVLAVVVGCFAVLWPRIFYPMFTASLIGDSGDEVCCDVMSEKDTNAYHLMTEICGNILRRDSKLPPPLDSGQPGKKIEISKPAANLCRNEILKQCGVDVLLLLKENAAMTKEYKKSLNQIRSFNTSHCLKISYGVDVVEEIGLARMTKGPFSSPSHMRPERHLRPELMHPALREKGQAIPSPRVPRRTIDREARPGPVPGMRPPMAQAAHVPNTPKGSGTMGIVMPMYTFGIICFFVYTLMKLVSWYFMVNVTCDYVYSCLCILFKKPADEISPPVKPQPILKDLIDPDHRKYGAYSSSEDAYPNGSERSKKVVDDYKQKEDANRRKASAGAAAGKSDTFKGRLGARDRDATECEQGFLVENSVERGILLKIKMLELSSLKTNNVGEVEIDSLRRQLEETQLAMERMITSMGSDRLAMLAKVLKAQGVDLEQPKGSIKEENKKSEEKAKLEPERKSSVKRHPSAEKEVTFQLPEAKKPEVEDDEEEEEVEEEEEEEEEPVRPPTPPRHGGSKKSKHNQHLSPSTTTTTNESTTNHTPVLVPPELILFAQQLSSHIIQQSAAAAIALAKQASSPQSQQHREILSVLGIEETAEMESGEKWDDRTPTPTFRMATPPVPHRAPSPPEDIPSIFLEGPLPMAGQQLMVSDSQVEMEGGDYGDDYENNTAPIILSGKVTLSVISGGGGAPDEITDASSLSYDDKGKNKNKTAIKAEKGLSNARKTPASTSHKEYEDIKKGFKNDEDSDDVDLTTYLTAEADNDGQNNKEDTEGDISVMGKIEELPKDEE
ncbi:uncharacterized protein LOC110853549 isoform X14 [Folsomia candida]|uniref:uncharacterized protein LOC110853549 isoform X14 n=1 Tax=Folsomia candida TaxID=158441 RepID=UPI0016055569|nr:uncharacterized protein LOC110853549 isoform X14 [Folsomia candida]